MEQAFNTIFYILTNTFPYSILWALGTLCYKSIVDALSGRNVILR